MSIKRALDSILEGNLDEMRQNFSSALTTKAVEKLEERKIEIAKNYFGQMQEENQLDELRKLKSPMDVLGYMMKARKQIGNMNAYDISPEGDEAMKTGKKRTDGMKNLMKKAKRAQKKGMQEEAEELDEVLDTVPKAVDHINKHNASHKKAIETGDKNTMRKREKGEELLKNLSRRNAKKYAKQALGKKG